ncbi:MAG TPA: hypothetical protein VGN26_04085 [Armatimonadota bacterium]
MTRALRPLGVRRVRPLKAEHPHYYKRIRRVGRRVLRKLGLCHA